MQCKIRVNCVPYTLCSGSVRTTLFAEDFLTEAKGLGPTGTGLKAVRDQETVRQAQGRLLPNKGSFSSTVAIEQYA